MSLYLLVIWDEQRNQVGIRSQNKRTEQWELSHKSELATLFNQFSIEKRQMSKAALHELGLRILHLMGATAKVAPRGEAIRVRTVTGRIHTPSFQGPGIA